MNVDITDGLITDKSTCTGNKDDIDEIAGDTDDTGKIVGDTDDIHGTDDTDEGVRGTDKIDDDTHKHTDGHGPQQAMLIYDVVRASGLPNYRGCKITLPSGLKIQNWRRYLKNYSDKQVVDYLEYGFPIGYTDSCWPKANNINHSSAMAYPLHVKRYIETECAHGALLGPFNHSPFRKGLHTSPMLTRPKKNSENRRVILDLSWPKNHSVNSGIPKDTYLGEPYKLVYPSIDNMADLVRQYGTGAKLYVADIERAYRNLRCDPLDWPLMGLQWDNTLYVDMSIAFGLRTGAFFCQRMTDAIRHISDCNGAKTLNYIDDICGISTAEKAEQDFSKLLNLLQELGLPIARDKIQAPATSATWLGVTFDTIKMEYCICQEKITEILQEVRHWLTKNAASVNEMQKLLGKLLYISCCCKPARLFLGRMLDTLRQHYNVTGPITLDVDFKKDLCWFSCFLPTYNGIAMIHRPSAAITVEVDACLVRGAGITDNKFYSCSMPDFIQRKTLHISQLEMLNLTVAVKLWASEWAGKSVLIYCDNAASVATLAHGRARDSFLLKCAREIWFYTAKYDVQLQVEHKPGKQLKTVDRLSRLHELSDKDSFIRNLDDNGYKCVEVDSRLFKLCEQF